MKPVLPMPRSTAEQVSTLESMDSAPPHHDERLRLGLPADDLYGRLMQEPLMQKWYPVREIVLARQETERRILREVRRGLKTAFLALSGSALWALRVEQIGLSAFLLLLTLTCLPLHSLAQPTTPEVR